MYESDEWYLQYELSATRKKKTNALRSNNEINQYQTLSETEDLFDVDATTESETKLQ
jgi:hypothetical protein